MKKRVWIAKGDIVLVALREFQDKKVDIIDKYSQNHVHQLVKEKEFPLNLINGRELKETNSTNKNEIIINDNFEDDLGFDFEYDTNHIVKKPVEKPKTETKTTSDFNFDEI